MSLHPVTLKAMDHMRSEKILIPPCLVRHHEVVQETAEILLAYIKKIWPGVVVDREAVLVGASSHDLGKAIFHEEMFVEGLYHVSHGPKILQEAGMPEEYCRFARTHYYVEESTGVEDVIVALANKSWNGHRHSEYEAELLRRMKVTGEQARSSLEKVMRSVVANGAARIVYQRFGRTEVIQYRE